MVKKVFEGKFNKDWGGRDIIIANENDYDNRLVSSYHPWMSDDKAFKDFWNKKVRLTIEVIE